MVATLLAAVPTVTPVGTVPLKDSVFKVAPAASLPPVQVQVSVNPAVLEPACTHVQLVFVTTVTFVKTPAGKLSVSTGAWLSAPKLAVTEAFRVYVTVPGVARSPVGLAVMASFRTGIPTTSA